MSVFITVTCSNWDYQDNLYKDLKENENKMFVRNNCLTTFWNSSISSTFIDRIQICSQKNTVNRPVSSNEYS